MNLHYYLNTSCICAVFRAGQRKNMKTFKSKFEVYFEDISPSEKVHLEKLVEWMSMAREKFFKETCPKHKNFINGSTRMFTTDLSLNITGCAKWTDSITSILTTEKIKKISFQMHLLFRNDRTEETIATGTQKVAFVDSRTQKFTDIPDNMKQIIVKYCKKEAKG